MVLLYYRPILFKKDLLYKYVYFYTYTYVYVYGYVLYKYVNKYIKLNITYRRTERKWRQVSNMSYNPQSYYNPA